MSEERKLGMLIDLSACIGCNACVVACKQENEVPLGNFNTWIESWDAGDYPEVSRANLPKLCNHCTDAPCVAVCPTEASYVSDDGLVLINEEECIGCSSCITACPYGARWEKEESKIAQKCTFCNHRTEYGLLPACTMVCPTHSRVFGDLNDAESDIAQRISGATNEVLLPEQGLETAVTYIGLTEMLGMPVSSGICKGGNVITRLGEM